MMKSNVLPFALTVVFLGLGVGIPYLSGERAENLAPTERAVPAAHADQTTLNSDVISAAVQAAVQAQESTQIEAALAIQKRNTELEFELSSAQTELEVLRAELEETRLIAASHSGGTCLAQLRQASSALTIFFPPASASLDGNALQNIRAFKSALSACPEVIVHAAGHSDATGDETANITLSWKRADAVVSALEAAGVNTRYVDAVGFGTRKPSAQGDTDDDLDRRVEFHILEKH